MAWWKNTVSIWNQERIILGNYDISFLQVLFWKDRRSCHLEKFLGKGVLIICSKFTGEHPCRSAFSIKLLCNFIEIAPRHGCSPVNLLHIFRTPFPKNTLGRLLKRHSKFERMRYCNCSFITEKWSFIRWMDTTELMN